MIHFAKWLLVKLFGVPVCAGCNANHVDCVGWCKKNDVERTNEYLDSIKARVIND